jgi:hypothetical protein
MMIEAAIEACARRRKLVFKYYEQHEMIQSRARDHYSTRDEDPQDDQFRVGHAN